MIENDGFDSKSLANPLMILSLVLYVILVIYIGGVLRLEIKQWRRPERIFPGMSFIDKTKVYLFDKWNYVDFMSCVSKSIYMVLYAACFVKFVMLNSPSNLT